MAITAKQSAGFQFKQFFIAHDHCAMKVNTDGILLGAIADVSHAQRILDLGTGSGLIAIMLAQRTACNTKIIGVELEEKAFTQAQQNAKNSPWTERISILQADISQLNFTQPFDLIVSNPPYFEHSLASRNTQRDLARTATQSHLTWLANAKQWLTVTGKICFILPLESAEKLVKQAKSLELNCIEKWFIHTKAGKAPKRAIVTFSPVAPIVQQTVPTDDHTVQKSLEIYQANNEYSVEFKTLTQDFYLNF